MTIRVALHHQTRYTFDRAITLSPHEIRLRPAAHCRTPIESYSLRIAPAKHFLNWQQDPYGNWVARAVFPEKTDSLQIEVDLVADMTVINPFDFFVESYAESFPFDYPAELKRELSPYLELEPAGPQLEAWIDAARRELLTGPISAVNFLVGINVRLQHAIKYLIRMEAGVQTPDETLTLGCGSCRDSAWLMVQIARRFGLAARFASGYLIQLVADVKPLDGPAGTQKDFTDLHAWAEVYIPGAGWIGLDPTSGLLAGEGHIPLACTAVPSSAAPVTGMTEVAQTQFQVVMTVTRIHEDPRVTLPYSDAQWGDMNALGEAIDAELAANDVRLTMGGEPTFVSVDDTEGPEWNFTALSDKKLALATDLLQRLQKRFAPGALLQFGQGKWYPGEPLPRWALSCYWRPDGEPMWHNRWLLAMESTGAGVEEARRFSERLAQSLDVHAGYVMPAYENVWRMIRDEAQFPLNVDPLALEATSSAQRVQLVEQLTGKLGKAIAYVLPLRPILRETASAPTQWQSSLWPLRSKSLFLVEGTSPAGMRLPLNSLPWIAAEDEEIHLPGDPFADRAPLERRIKEKAAEQAARANPKAPRPKVLSVGESAREVVRTAIVVEPRDGILHVFMPPLQVLEDYLRMIGVIEHVAAELKQPLRLEGYGPPDDPRIRKFAVTPDPGVIEVNIHPSHSWAELRDNTVTLYEEARLARLASEKFMVDGRHTGTGGGNHVTLGGATPADSPMLRRPDLLKSLVLYWQNHPALSYLFSGMFVGPTSQSPRVDEARDDALYELEIAFEQLDEQLATGEESKRPWLVDRILRNFLVDLTGNTHRAEFSIDKMYSPDSPTGRLGLLEFRAFEMPPHPRMSLLQTLLLRTLVARFWKTPYTNPPIAWGTALHDRFMLPHFIAQDMRFVIDDINAALPEGAPHFSFDWFAPFVEFRFPRFGTVNYQGIAIELRQAIEPWHVLGEAVSTAGAARYVDSSVERLQIKVTGMTEARHVVTCNGRTVPLTATGVPGEFVAGVRYRAWAPWSALHPTIEIHAPLVFDLVDTWALRSVGGCTYHVAHPGGRNYDTFPVNANEAEARRVARFVKSGHTPGPMEVRRESLNPAFPLTLDLRRKPDYTGAAPLQPPDSAR